MKFATQMFNISHHILPMLLHYLEKFKSSNLLQIRTRSSTTAEEPRDVLRQLKYYGNFLTELLTRSSANPEEPCEHTVS